jgi:hypothetical protein
MLQDHYHYELNKSMYKLFYKDQFLFLFEIFFFKLLMFKYKNIFANLDTFRSNFRLATTKHGFYFNFEQLQEKKKLVFFKNFFFLSGIKFFWKSIKL